MSSIALGEDLELLAATARRWCEAAVEKGARRDPAVVDLADLAALGWLDLPGLPELAVVVEELGRAGIGGPFLPTALASRLAPIPPGTAAAVAFAGLDAVLGASGAGVLVVPDAGGGWRVAPTGDATVTPVPGTDLFRSVAAVELAGPVGDPDPAGRDLAALLLSAEAVGIAAWCVETAAAYAKQRVQFGRPIGQFQAVKHRCADMLARLELARAAVWDACRGGADPAEARFAVACAAALAPAAAVQNAKDCIQVLGGIGFTWEHDAHLFLRRALTTSALLPRPRAWHAAALDAVRAGTTRTTEVELPAEADAIRSQVRAWLDELRAAPPATWNDRIVEDGYLAPHWPRPYGRGAGPVEQVVIDQEFRRARVRRPHLQVAAWALPTLIEHGTPEQQARWMGPSMRRELRWCQLFSEPEAGSDLASLRTRATRVDGGWSLTGQKVWTSMAAEADWGICLARTSPDKPDHEGITCFFVDMRSPGIEIRPLRELTGEAWFNEVFLDDVFVPDDCVIGAVDDGWRVGRTTLANERVAMGSGSSIGAGVSALVGLLPDAADPVDADLVGAHLATDHALNALRTRMTLRALAGADAGPEASVVKLLGVLHDQDVQETGVALLAAGATRGDDPWVRAFLWNRCLSIAGGTSEIQRNVIAERLLGLPRDP